MRRSASDTQVRLTVRAADGATEIFLINSQFQRIAHSVGLLETSVMPGIYKARFRVGQHQADRFIEVAPDLGAKVVDGPAVAFAGPAPLARTLTDQEVHGQAAQALSRSVMLRLGRGSGIFLFIRDLSGACPAPWVGVSLHDSRGRLLAAPEQGECRTEQGFFGLSLEVDPGTYRLRLEEEPGEVYETFIVTLPGWQTQVFALTEPGWLPGIERPCAELPAAAVFMAEQGKGFDPADPGARAAELLRQGLLHGRQVLSGQGLQALREQQPLNPMQAVYAAQLLARQHAAEDVIQAEQHRELFQLLAEAAPSHPDLRAVLLHRGLAPAEEGSDFSLPPMLRSSWEYLVQASMHSAVQGGQALSGSFSDGSLNKEIAPGVLGTSLWLTHRMAVRVGQTLS